MPSIFTKIVSGEIPCYKIMEDEWTLSFLTIEPINPGHTLIICKQEVNHYMDVPKDVYLKIMEHSQTIGNAIKKAFNPNRVCLAAQGFEVPHFHLHLIPCQSPKDFSFANAKPASKDELLKAQEKIKSYLQ